MTTIDTNSTTLHPSLRDRATAFFARVGKGLDWYLNIMARTRQIDALNSLTDQQLAAKGLRREDIVRHVFRDRMI